MSRVQRNQLLLLLTAAIWGTTFVAQESICGLAGPATFNCLRSIVAFVVMLPFLKVLDRMGVTERIPRTGSEWYLLIKAGTIGGFFLTVASLAQQLALYWGASAGKAGFLTACYIIIVPLLGSFTGRRCGWNVWLAVVLALGGLFLLCIKENSFFLQPADLMLLLCSFFFAVQIMIVDKYAPQVEGVRMSMVQFVLQVVISAVPMILFESGTSAESISRWAAPLFTPAFLGAMLYAAVFSSGIAYTLQIIGQQGVNPAVASLLMSLESVFAVLAGWIFLGETMSLRELLGCAVMFAAILLAQLPGRKF